MLRLERVCGLSKKHFTDQLFSVIVALMLQKSHFLTPIEMLDTLHQRMQTRHSRRGEELSSQLLTGVRDYSSWLLPLRRHLHHGFATRAGIESAHSFAYKPRALTPGFTGDGNSWDVLCNVKAYMRDLHLNQEPLLVLLPASVENVTEPLPTGVVPLRPCSQNRIESLLSLADALQRPQFNLPTAAAAIRDLLRSTAYDLMGLPWLTHPRQVEVAELEALQGPAVFPHLPRTTWPLMVKNAAKTPRREDAPVCLPVVHL